MPIDVHSRLTPDLPEVPIEKGISRLIGILNARGLATTMSCEGHHEDRRKSAAWVNIEPCAFKAYMRNHATNMERFLRVGEQLWDLNVRYFGVSRFRGLGRVRPRKKALKRHVQVEMTVTISLNTTVFEKAASRKTSAMRAIEIAAQKYL